MLSCFCNSGKANYYLYVLCPWWAISQLQMSDGNVLKVEQVAHMCVRVTCVMCHVSCVPSSRSPTSIIIVSCLPPEILLTPSNCSAPHCRSLKSSFAWVAIDLIGRRVLTRKILIGLKFPEFQTILVIASVENTRSSFAGTCSDMKSNILKIHKIRSSFPDKILQ